MEKDEQNPEVVAGEETTTEEETVEVETLPETPSSVDPLDTMAQEDLLKEAKKLRAIASRKEKKEEKPVEKQPDSPFMTKKDFELSMEKKAILKAKEEKEIADNFEEISKWYVNRNGRDTEETILKDIKIAHKSWKANKEDEVVDPTKDLTTNVISKPSGSHVKVDKKEEKNFWPVEKDLKDVWYPTSKK